MSHNNSGYIEEDNQSVVSSSGSEEYIPKLNDFLGIESDGSVEEMNFIGQHPTNLQIPVIPIDMAQQMPSGVGQFSLAPPVMAAGLQDTRETSEDILEFMSKQSKIIGSNMMEEMTSPIATSAGNVYEPSSEMETVIAADIGSQVTNDAVPTAHLGQEVLTKHSTLQTNGVVYIIYAYRWVCKWQHISLTILASNNQPPLIPYKDLAYKVLSDVAARALSTKISKLGYQMVSLPEEHIQLLQQHDVMFKKNYKFMYLVDFVRLCKLYDVKIPESLEDLYSLNASHSMEDIQSGKVASLTSDLYQNQQASRIEHSMTVELDHSINNNVTSQSGFMPVNTAAYQTPIYHHGQGYYYPMGSCSFPQMSNNLVHIVTSSSAVPGGQEMSIAGPSNMPTMRLAHMPQAGYDGRISRSATSSPMKSSTLETLQNTRTEGGGGDMKYDARNFITTNGQQLTLIVRDDGCYLCANDIVSILPQFNRSFLEKKRGMRYVNANRLEIELLKQRGLVAKKACRAALYSAKTIVDICYSSSVQPPSFLADFACEKYPEEKVTIDNIKAVMEHIRLNQQRVGKADDNVETTPEHKRSNSEKVLPEDNSLGNDVRLCSLPWGSVELHLLQPPEGEPYISISEVSNKLLNIDAKRCQQRRQRMQIHSIHATVHQMQLLRSSGALKGAYCKLIRITDAVKLCQSFGLGVPDNVKEECQRYEEPTVKQELSSDVASNLSRSTSLNDISSQEEDGILDATTMTDGVIDNTGSQSGVGSFQRIKWDREGTKEIVIYTSTEGVHYCGLHELYNKVLQNTVERFTLKTRMRKLGVRSMRAPPLVRIKLIELHSLPSHSPVCALILLSEAESLVRSFHLPVPHVIYDTFLKSPFATASNSMVDSLIVSIPKRISTTELSLPSLPGKLYINPATMSATAKPSGSALQSIARKISRKNHKIAQQRQHGLFSHRRCPSCGHFTPSLKKRCQKCQSFLVGRACPACNELNHNRSVFCNKCHTSLYPDKSGVNVKLGTVQVISSSVQSNTYHPMSQSQAPVITQSQTTLASQASSFSGNGDAVTSPLSPRLQFSAPPMRAAALKTLFPSDTGDDGSSSKQLSVDVDASKKFLTSTHYRSCPECSQPNPRSAKKCQKCQKPLQGKACPQCGRPNHSWVPSCYKCGTSLPSYLGKTGKRNTGARHIPTFYNNYVIVDKEESTIPVNACVRCYDVKLSGSFKCGRCGCSFKTKPVNDKSSLSTEASSNSQLDPLEGVFLVDFSAENLNLSPNELTTRLNDTLIRCQEELHKVEELRKGITEEYEATHSKRLRRNTSLHDLQAEVDSLVDQSVSLQHSLKDSQERMKHCEQVVAFYPDKIKALEEKIKLIRTTV